MDCFIRGEIQKLFNVLQHILDDAALLKTVEAIAIASAQALKLGRKILFIGNGGSAADSQHLAAELVVRLRTHRPGIKALALTTDTSALTAIGNDYSFEQIFARQVETLGEAGDVLIAISTSGKSPNILRALEVARHKALFTVGLTGKEAPFLTERCDIVLNVPSNETPKIQECHIMFGHIICALIEDILFAKQEETNRITAIHN